jgi:hypothetical protein
MQEQAIRIPSCGNQFESPSPDNVQCSPARQGQVTVPQTPVSSASTEEFDSGPFGALIGDSVPAAENC